MKRESEHKGGYVGLLAMLISVLLIGWWMWVGFGKTTAKENGMASSTPDISTVGGQLKTVDSARQAKNTLESLNRKMGEEAR